MANLQTCINIHSRMHKYRKRETPVPALRAQKNTFAPRQSRHLQHTDTQRVAKQAILDCKTGHIALRNDPFCSPIWPVLQNRTDAAAFRYGTNGLLTDFYTPAVTPATAAYLCRTGGAAASPHRGDGRGASQSFTVTGLPEYLTLLPRAATSPAGVPSPTSTTLNLRDFIMPLNLPLRWPMVSVRELSSQLNSMVV